MAFIEASETLRDIPVCFVCGENNEKLLNIDHRRPKSIIYIPKNGKSAPEIQAAKQQHPFYLTVNDPANQYKVDIKHHIEADSEKIAKFLGTWKFDMWNDPDTIQGYLESLHRGEPEALERWLIRNYPWSQHPYFFSKQQRMITFNNWLFQESVKKSADYYPEFYVKKLERAAALARQQNQEIHCMATPSLKFVVGFNYPEKRIKPKLKRAA